MSSATRANLDLLIADAREGAIDSLGKLLQTFHNYLRIVAATQIEPQLRARVSPSDVVQETMLEAHRDFNQFQGNTEAEFLGWLRRILVNNLSRVVERHVLADKRDVRREVSLDQMQGKQDRSNFRLAALLADHATSPSTILHRQEETLLLANSLSRLPAIYRDILVMRNLEGLPFSEIAKRLQRTPGACRMLWMRALEQLRTFLKSEGAA